MEPCISSLSNASEFGSGFLIGFWARRPIFSLLAAAGLMVILPAVDDRVRNADMRQRPPTAYAGPTLKDPIVGCLKE
jgi:hypothetical protein